MKVKMTIRMLNIKVSALEIDRSYQRNFDEARAKRIAAAFRVDRLGTLEVSCRTDGTYWILDGQHRHAAMSLAGYAEEEITCRVHYGLTPREEARLFRGYQKDRKALTAWDDWHAGLREQDPFVLEVERIVSGWGMKIGQSGPLTIRAIGTIKRVHIKNQNLSTTLSVISAWALEDQSSFEGQLIEALSSFLKEYSDDQHRPGQYADPETLVRKLQKVGPSTVLNQIHRETGSRSDRVTLREAACRAFRAVYNTRTKRRQHLVTLNELRDLREAERGARKAVPSERRERTG